MRSEAEAHCRDYLGSFVPSAKAQPLLHPAVVSITTNMDNLSLHASETCLDVPAWENGASQP